MHQTPVSVWVLNPHRPGPRSLGLDLHAIMYFVVKTVRLRRPARVPQNPPPPHPCTNNSKPPASIAGKASFRSRTRNGSNQQQRNYSGAFP